MSVMKPILTLSCACAADVAKPADADQTLRRQNSKSKNAGRSSSFIAVDVSDKHAVWSVAAGAEAFVNCAVSRHGRVSPWEVNCKGVYNSLTAAVSAGESFRFASIGQTVQTDR